ncbi:hypothetical protein BDM02DRAFT_3127786 [Thelephora ganbajun]|uniref:Uncharacterized protein n=1 Tax=Thelephora ganbajun TaxID=370292 RepID=A0ACB6ZL76_THEGA|nr:hypothetical protein BDM02DRAFT_3127786 [Thelephora ganbajun]
MDHETNVDPTLALDKRIEEITAELIQLKRSRNSLLTVSRAPPEILGQIFRLNIETEDGDPQFAGIRKGSYNFLFVCYQWFEVARSLPELWSYWGNSLESWKGQEPLSGTSPLDLVLDGVEHRVGSFDETLRDALKDYTARNAIRKVHLRGNDIPLLTDIISSLTPDDPLHDSNIESLALNGLDLSDFFTRQRFPQLRDLSLSGRFMIWDWDYLARHTMALVNLSLSSNSLSWVPRTSHLLLLLASNPNIRRLSLESLTFENDTRRGSDQYRVSLRHLERLSLTGEFYHVFPILDKLELPERLDYARLEFSEWDDLEAERSIGPYIRDYLQRDPRFEDRPGIFVSLAGGRITIRVSAIGVGYHGPDRLPPQGPPEVTFSMIPPDYMSPDQREELCVNILALLPRETSVYFETDLSMTAVKKTIVAMSNLEALYLIRALVEERFLLPRSRTGPKAHKKLLPSLQRLYLQDWVSIFTDCSPLINYVTHQTSGNHPFSLYLLGRRHICSGPVEQLEALVEELGYDSRGRCPVYECDQGLTTCRTNLRSRKRGIEAKKRRATGNEWEGHD